MITIEAETKAKKEIEEWLRRFFPQIPEAEIPEAIENFYRYLVSTIQVVD